MSSHIDTKPNFYRHLQPFKIMLLWIFFVISSPFYLLIAVIVGCIGRHKMDQEKLRLVWGSTPIINNSYWSKSMQKAGYTSETFTNSFYSTINCRDDWDRILDNEFNFIPRLFKPFIAFLDSLLRYDVFFLSCNGFFIGNTPLWRFQAPLLKLAGKKIVIIPYGSDSYIYYQIRSTSTIHGLLMSYPQASRNQHKVKYYVDYWCYHADVVIPGIMGPDGFGRWDVLTPSPLCIDLELWQKSLRLSNANGKSSTVRIAHAPNHRGVKGTEFIINSVKILQEEGLSVELVLLEKLKNSEVRQFFHYEIDVLIEQIIMTGHGLNALEGLASGLPVISNLEDQSYILPMRRWSYFSECPIVSATPENLVDILRKLITRPSLRHQLGKAGREYVEKYHGLDSAQYLFSNVIDYLYGRKESLINLYHPILGEYPNRKPRVEHPLVNNRIID